MGGEESSLGDTIRVWVIEIDGKRLVFEAATTEQAGPDVERDIQQIVESIRSDDVPPPVTRVLARSAHDFPGPGW